MWDVPLALVLSAGGGVLAMLAGWRLTLCDEHGSDVIARVRGFHRSDTLPPVAHWVAVNVTDDAAGDVL